jgi:hypothetical protein
MRRTAIHNQSRVNLATAAWTFERAALDCLSGRPFQKSNVDKACRLLIAGINHTLLWKKQRASRPCFRLYDFLAGLAVRYRQEVYLQECIRMIDVGGLNEEFAARVEKWTDPASPWRKKWLSKKPVAWHKTILSSN